MKLSEFKNQLSQIENLDFYLENGIKIPAHFHITEVGLSTKHFTDCGNTFRVDKKATLQLWTNLDFNHRIEPKKLLKIIESTSSIFEGEDLEIEMEYQLETVSKFGLSYQNNSFVLTNTKTACLAMEACGFPQNEMAKIGHDLMTKVTDCCSNDKSCC
jgi:hypothetical protein